MASPCNDQGKLLVNCVLSAPSKVPDLFSPGLKLCPSPSLDLRSPTIHLLGRMATEGEQRGETEGRGQNKGAGRVPGESERPHRQELLGDGMSRERKAHVNRKSKATGMRIQMAFTGALDSQDT